AFLHQSCDLAAPVCADWNAVKRHTKIIASHLQPVVLLAIKPGKSRIARKVIGPRFKRCGQFNAEFCCFGKNRRPWIRRKDIRPEFRAGKPAADAHHEVNGLAPLFSSLAGESKDDVE